jgi:hypothetical protein
LGQQAGARFVDAARSIGRAERRVGEMMAQMPKAPEPDEYMDMDDDERLARLEQKIDGIERKIDDLIDGLRRFTILAISVVLAWVVADII